MQITHIVSLGGNCRVTYHLRRHFNFRSAYPFDWWISPLSSITRFLTAPDLARLYDPDLCEPHRIPGGIYSVRNTYYDVFLHHEFPRRNTFVVENFRDFMEAPRRRTAYLMDKFRALNEADNQILLVRNAVEADRSVTAPDLRAFVDAVKTILDRARCAFLFINLPLEVSGPGVATLRFDDIGPPWKGDSALWERQLSRLSIEFLNVEGTHLVETDIDPDVDSKLS